MSAHVRNLLSQPFVGITTLTVALTVLAASWISAIVGSSGGGQPLLSTLLVLALVVALVMVQWFPIQVRRGGKIHMGSVPIYHLCLKEGKLTDEEWAIMKSHPEQGAELLKRYPDFARDGEIVDAFLHSIAGRLEEPVAPTLRLVPRPSEEAVIA